MEGSTTAMPAGRDVLRTAGPRVLRDALTPLLAFYVFYKTLGTAAGVIAATAAGLGVAALARREGRAGMIAGTAVLFVCVRGAAGLIGDSARAYLAGDVVMDALLATAFFTSVLRRRPLAEAFAGDIFPIPDDAAGTEEARAVFMRLSLLWMAFFLTRGTLRLLLLLFGSVDQYVLLQIPFDLAMLGLMAWSGNYALRAYRTSELRDVGLQPEQQPAG